MKILLVDDSSTMRSIQKTILSALDDVEFAEAADGVEGLVRVAAGTFDLIFVDCNMPNMDGITFIQRVRATNKRTPLIMVTTEAERSRIMGAIKAGVTNYVIKPFTPEVLLDKVRQTLAKAAAQKQTV
jgi:two-component system, chemotaxis family, chemotaxis protein CheY